jgi:hypothetical protein
VKRCFTRSPCGAFFKPALKSYLCCGKMAMEGGIDMEAYQFYATPENGVIQIPERYKDKIPSRAKVTVQVEEASSIRDILLPPSLDTRGWKFDREEANERR